MTAATVTLEDITATTVTRQLIALAKDGGLRPYAMTPDRYGRTRVILNGVGRDALFGAIDISARTGKVLRAYLTHGNWGEEQKYEKVTDIRTALKSWAAIQRTR